jgi:hypothetical protein
MVQRRNDATMRHCHATRAVGEADGCERDDATVLSDVPFVRTRRRLRAYLGVAVTEAPCPLLRSAVPHVEFALHRLSSGWLRTRRGGSCPSATQDDTPAKQCDAHHTACADGSHGGTLGQRMRQIRLCEKRAVVRSPSAPAREAGFLSDSSNSRQNSTWSCRSWLDSSSSQSVSVTVGLLQT